MDLPTELSFRNYLTTTKERLLKQKFITYRKPKLSTTTKQVSKSLINTSSSAAQKAIQSLAKPSKA